MGKVKGKKKKKTTLLKLYIKFFGGKIFTAKRVVFSGRIFFGAQFTTKNSTCVTKSELIGEGAWSEVLIFGRGMDAKNVDVLYFCRLASKNLRAMRVQPRTS